MFGTQEEFIAEAKRLRSRCVDAHNVLVRDANYSPVGELVRALPTEYEFDGGSPSHLMISSYTFWGSREFGGSRRGLEKRLDRLAKPWTLELHAHLKSGLFGAYKCIAASTETSSSRWRTVGPEVPDDHNIELITDGESNPVEAMENEIRAGWIVDKNDDGDAQKRMLLFSIALNEIAAKRIIKTAAEHRWHDKKAGKGDPFRRIEYELDVLTQACCPEYEECGLHRYYFLPPAQRETFPDEFRRQMVRSLIQKIEDGDLPWHILLATADHDWLAKNLVPHLRKVRSTAARRAGRFRGQRIDFALLPRLVNDEECFSLLGLLKDGTVAVDLFPPVSTHSLHLMNFEDQWLEATGLNHLTPIHEARRHLRNSNPEAFSTLQAAISSHRRRLRWVNIVDRAIAQSHFNPRVLRPGYNQLRLALDILFDPIFGDRPLTEILPDKRGLARRTESTLINAGLSESFVRIGDLPKRRYELRNIKGVGTKSMQGITEGLRQALLSWPLELRRSSSEVDSQATEEIDDGLDELDALFE